MADVMYIEDDTRFDDNIDGIQIHAECLSQDYDDIAWEPDIDDAPAVDPNDDKFGFYN